MGWKRKQSNNKKNPNNKENQPRGCMGFLSLASWVGQSKGLPGSQC